MQAIPRAFEKVHSESGQPEIVAHLEGICMRITTGGLPETLRATAWTSLGLRAWFTNAAVVAIVVTMVPGMITGPVASAGSALLYTTPFAAGDEGYRIFRIPAVWTGANQPVLAFAEGRVESRKARGNIDIVLRRSLDGGQTWEPMQVVADMGGDFCGNPCVVQDPGSGRIWLAFTRSPGDATEEEIVARTKPPTRVYVTSSDDAGATWAEPADISAAGRRPSWGWYGTGPGLGLFLRRGDGGRILIPAYHSEAGIYRAHCLYSDDRGATWNLGADVADNTGEPQVVDLPGVGLLMNARTSRPADDATRTLAISRDRGQTWQPAEGLAPLPERKCQGCLYRAYRSGTNGVHDLVFTQPHTSGRVGVEAFLSEDDGRSWPHVATLWRGPSAYTAMIRAHDGFVNLLVECGEKDTFERIAFLKFSTEWLRAAPPPP
jgi:sialidase-1